MVTPTPVPVAVPTRGGTPPPQEQRSPGCACHVALRPLSPVAQPHPLPKRGGGPASAASSGRALRGVRRPESAGCSEGGETSPQAPCPCPAAQRPPSGSQATWGPTRTGGWAGRAPRSLTQSCGVACGSWVLRFNHLPLRTLTGTKMGPRTQGRGVGEPGLDPVCLTLRRSPFCTPPLSPGPLLNPPHQDPFLSRGCSRPLPHPRRENASSGGSHSGSPWTEDEAWPLLLRPL